MLVLSRKQNERIQIGDDIMITVVRVAGNRVRIGIEAPPEMNIARPEHNCQLAAETESETHAPACVANSTLR